MVPLSPASEFLAVGLVLTGVCRRRGSRKLEQPVIHGAAAEENFFLRGFDHLLVFKKERRRAAGDGR